MTARGAREPEPSGGAPASGLRRMRSAVLVVLCLGSAWGTSHAFRAWLPWPAGGGLAAKVEAFADHKDEYDLVFFGSSRVAHGYVPEIIDAELTAAGHPLRSFNFGVDGMGSFETDHLVRRVLAMEPARLRYAVVELEAWVARRATHPRVKTDRSVAWHDLRQTFGVLRSIHNAFAPLALKWETARVHLELMGQRLVNAGRGRWWLAGLLVGFPGADEVTPAEVVATGGFIPYRVDGDPGLERIRDRFLVDPSGYEQAVARLTELDSPDSALRTYNMACLRSQIEAIESAGVEVIYALGPSVKGKAFAQALLRGGHVPTLLDFHRPARYPELYEVRYRLDGDHLNQEGAEVFSRAFAAELARHLSERRAR